MKASDLRKSILQAAVHGQLVPQDEHDEPAIELLARIKAEKARRIKEGTLKKEKPLSPIAEDEVPYGLPTGWEWVRLGEICETNIGLTYKPSELAQSGLPILRSNNIQNGKIDLSNLVYVHKEVGEKLLVSRGDILICVRNGSKRLVGKAALIERELMSFGAFMAIIRSTYNSYLLCFINSPIFRSQIQGNESNTTTINQITQGMLKEVKIPLPPLAEQQRIVAKVEELMVLCDELEAAEKLANALDANLFENLPKSILQAAVQGNLVPQDEQDEPASELLKRITAEKARRIKEGTLKKEKPLPPIVKDEVPYALPTGWEWVRLGEICETNIGLTYKPSELAQSGLPILRSNNIQNGKIDLSNLVYVHKEVGEKLLVSRGDILICVRNGSKRLVGKAALIERELMSFGAFMAIIRSTCSPYLLYFINSPIFRSQIQGNESDTTTINQITQGMLKEVKIPLPPLAEQQRIVAKVEEMIILCNKLSL